MAKRLNLTEADIARMSTAAQAQVREQLAKLTPSARAAVMALPANAVKPRFEPQEEDYWKPRRKKPKPQHRGIPWGKLLIPLLIIMLVILWRLSVGP